MKQLLSCFVIFLAFLTLPPRLNAVTTWTGLASAEWADAGNWQGTLDSTVALVFSGTTNTTNTNNDSRLLVLSAVTINATSAAWNIGGNAVSLNGSFIVNGTNSVTWGLATLLATSGKAYSFKCSSGTTNITGVLSGQGSLVSSGGCLVLSASNSYSGGTSINTGVLRFGNVYALGSGSVTIAANTSLQAGVSGTLANNMVFSASTSGFDTGEYTVTLSGSLSGNYLRKTGAGTLVLSNATNTQGEIDIYGGTVEYTDTGALGKGKINFASSGTLLAGVSGTIGTDTAPQGITVVAGFNGTLDTQGFDVTLSGTLTSGNTASVFTKAGSGTLTLASKAAFTGALELAQGTLAYTNVAALGTGTVKFTGNSTLQAGLDGAITPASLNVAAGVTGTFDTAGWTVTGSAALAGSGTLAVIGSGTLVLTGASNTIAGGLVVSCGALTLGSGSKDVSFTNSSLSIVNNTLIIYNTRTTGTIAGNISGAGALQVTGTGVLVLTGSNSYTGATVVQGGELDVNGSLAAGGGVSIGTGAVLGGCGWIGGPVAVSGGSIMGSGTTGIRLGRVSVDGISAFGGIVTAGDITVASGTATVAAQASVSSTTVLSVKAGATYVNSGTTSAPSLLVENGGTLSNSGLVSGTVNVAGVFLGAGKVQGSLIIKNSGELACSGSLVVNGALLVESGAKLSLGIALGGVSDQLVVKAGSVTLQSGSILNLYLSGLPVHGESVVLIDNLGDASISGVFGKIYVDGVLVDLSGNVFTYNGQHYQLLYNVDGTGDGVANDLELTVVPEPASGLLALLGAGVLARLGRRVA